MRAPLFRICVCWIVAFTLVGTTASFAGPKKREKHIEKFPPVDLSAYSTIFIEDFVVSDPKAAENPKREAKAKMATRNIPDFLKEVLSDDVFEEVVRGASEAKANAVTLNVDITTYKPGSRTARFMMAGAGKAKLHMNVRLLDAETAEELISFPIKRIWAWGGIVGGSKGIEDMDENIATELAMYLRQCKGVEHASASGG